MNIVCSSDAEQIAKYGRREHAQGEEIAQVHSLGYHAWKRGQASKAIANG